MLRSRELAFLRAAFALSNGLAIPATIFATQLPNIGRDWKVSVGLRRILKPNKINHFGIS